MAPTRPKPEPHWLNRKNMAASLGISVQAFDKWGIEPVARIGRSVYFDCRTVLNSRLAQAEAKQQSAQPDGEDVDPMLDYKRDQEEYRLTKARREAQELKNDRDARRVVPVEFAIFSLSRVVADVASQLDTLPMTMKRRHPDLEARHLDSLTREITRARNTAAGAADKMPAILDEYQAQEGS